jgi:hypothetical protein
MRETPVPQASPHVIIDLCASASFFDEPNTMESLVVSQHGQNSARFSD